MKISYSPGAVTFTFDLSPTKSNQHIHEPKYICVKFALLVFEIWSSKLWDAR